MSALDKLQISVRFIGFFEVTASDGINLCPKGQKSAGILAYLLFNVGRPVTREKLIDLFWSDRGMKQGQDSLRQALYGIRAAFGAHAEQSMVIDRRSILMRKECFQTDLWGRDDKLSEDLSGIFLENLDSTSPVFDEWLLHTRREIQNQQISDAEKRLSSIDIRKHPAQALQWAKAILALDPINEPAARQAMSIAALQGEIGQARRTYEQLNEQLRAHDLFVSNETRDLLKDLNSGLIKVLEQRPTGRVFEKPTDTRPLRDVPFVGTELSAEENCVGEEREIITDFYDRLLARLAQVQEIRVATKRSENEYQLSMSSGLLRSGFRIGLRLMAADNHLIWTGRQDLPPDSGDEEIQVSVDTLITQMLPALEEHMFHNISGEPDTAFGNFLYAKRHFSTAPTPNYMEQVLSYLHKAIELDQEFLPPYAHLVMHYNTGMFMSAPGSEHQNHRREAFELAQKLLFLNANYANAHISMGWCLLWRYKFDAAERSIRKAMDLNPYDPHRLNVIATALVYLGLRDEAEHYYEMAQERLHHDFDFQRTDYGELYYFRKSYERALSWMEIPEARCPYKTYFWRALAHAQLGRIKEAEQDMEAFAEDMGPRWKGNIPFVPEEGFQWYCDMLPVRMESDRQNLKQGMEKLGLNVLVNRLA